MSQDKSCRLLRLKDILGDPESNPPIPPIIPIGKTSWWAGVKDGRFPRPLKLGLNTTVWRYDDIAALVASLDEEAQL